MEENKDKEYHFLKEETKKIPTNKKKFCKKLGVIIVFAAIFGAVACLVFCLLKPVIEKQQEEKALTMSQQQEEVPSVDEPDQIVVQETIEPTIQGYETLQKQLYSIGNLAANSVVEISSVTNQKDWFEDDYESKGQSSGVILRTIGGEVLILTETDMIANANAIQVTFHGNAKAPAYLKAYDGNTGVAVVAVDQKDVSEEVKAMIKAVSMTQATTITPGSFVIGIGSPQGEAFSVVVGNVTSSSDKISFYDKNMKLISTSIEAYPETRGVLLNVDGQVVGLICEGEENDAVRAILISELDATLDKLIAGKRPAYLGVEISEITRTISDEYGLPDGVYIKKVDMDSPAVAAGLQVGDIIAEVDGKEVLTEAQFENYMASADPEQKMSVTIKRLGSNNQYKEVNLKIALGVAE